MEVFVHQEKPLVFGTARYASINSHKSKELGRRDDLWSVLYLLVEFAVGSLPWRKIKDKDRIGELKEKYTNKELVKDLPKEFYAFMESLQKLGYADEPDYDGLRGLLLAAYQRENYPMDLPFDWDLKDSSKTPPTVQVTSLLEEKEESKVDLYKEEIKKEKDESSSRGGGGKESREEPSKEKEPEKVPSKCAQCLIM